MKNKKIYNNNLKILKLKTEELKSPKKYNDNFCLIFRIKYG
jgi:hypothetical protein